MKNIRWLRGIAYDMEDLLDQILIFFNKNTLQIKNKI
jgi:hypothetical protein